MDLQKTCPSCNQAYPSQAQFCSGCGSKLPSKQASSAEAGKEDPLIGEMISDRFFVQKCIGEGGMGRVYQGMQTSIQRKVALKVLNPELTTQHNLQDRFRNEASLASRLNHPNTVIIYDFGVTEKGCLFIAMELIEGQSLDEELSKSSGIGWDRAINIALQICGSLQNAHENKIIHRDLKPENIMLTSAGGETDFVKVLDFGIAKILSQDDAAVKTGLTAPNEVFGTPDYMSPEQARGDVLDYRTDIYSLGIILFKMISGGLPFQAVSPIEMLARHLADPPATLSAVNPAAVLPDGLEALVMSTLNKSADDRPDSMKTLSQLLRDIQLSAAKPVHVPPKIATASPPESQVDIREQAPPQTNKVEAASETQPTPEHSKQVEPTQASPTDPMTKSAEDLRTSADIPEAEQARDSAPKPEQPSSPQRVNQDEEDLSPIQVLISRMKKMKDFPTVSQHISELNTKASHHTTSAPQLANVILKDTALTTKLIRLVNSPFYGHLRGKITMVSRAVVMMGFEAVREAAVGLLLFDQLSSTNPTQATEMRDVAVASLLSGITARKVAGVRNDITKEEAFVCAMFHNLGKHAAIFYFPEEMEQARNLMETENVPERAAVYRVLGVSLLDLGKELAHQWGFPDQICGSMDPLPPTELIKPRTKIDSLRLVASFSNELVEGIGISDPAERGKQLRAVSRRYGSVMKLDDDKIEAIITSMPEQIEAYSSIMHAQIDKSPFIQNLMSLSGAQSDKNEEQDALEYQTDTRGQLIREQNMSDEDFAVLSTRIKEEDIERKERVLSEGTDEVASSIRGRFDLNTVMLMVLETMYRGLDLHRVIFCINDVRKGVMRARSGFGEEVDALIPKFHFSLRGRGDFFTKAMSQGQDIFIEDCSTRKNAFLIPKWYQETIGAPMFLLYPIRIKRFPAALFYGDLASANVEIDQRLFDRMQDLRNQAKRAIELSQQIKPH